MGCQAEQTETDWFGFPRGRDSRVIAQVLSGGRGGQSACVLCGIVLCGIVLCFLADGTDHERVRPEFGWLRLTSFHVTHLQVGRRWFVRLLLVKCCRVDRCFNVLRCRCGQSSVREVYPNLALESCLAQPLRSKFSTRATASRVDIASGPRPIGLPFWSHILTLFSAEIAVLWDLPPK